MLLNPKNIMIGIIISLLLLTIVYNSWILQYTYNFLEKISCTNSTSSIINNCCGTSGYDIRGIQTLSIISLCISIYFLGIATARGANLLLNHIGWLSIMIISEFIMVFWVRRLLNNHNNKISCPVDSKLKYFNTYVIWITGILSLIVFGVFLRNK